MIACSICNGPVEPWPGGGGYGHNAQPINDGRCCNACNHGRVIPARLIKFVLADRDPWQLYDTSDSTKAREDLEASWSIASKMTKSRDAHRFMSYVMEHWAHAGAADSEGWQELDRRMRKIWPDWS